MQKHLIVICGPTGIGKTRVAIEVAKKYDCEIISADSRQVYREMRTGTAIPSIEEQNSVKHHFIQSHSIHQYYNASSFEEEVIAFLDDYYKGFSAAVLVGGSGLYIDAVCKGIDELPTITPEVRIKWKNLFKKHGLEFLQQEVKKTDPVYYEKVDRNNPKRLLKAIEVYELTGKSYSSFLNKEKEERRFTAIKIGLNTERDILYKKINHRVDKMIDNGLHDEAKKLYPYKHLTPLKTVGYKELFEHFENRISLEEAVEQIKNHSRAYARRQLTWFRRDKEITWFEPDEINDIISYIQSKINP